jgi:NADPH-dependent 2,4-dienoyl-CoA reductase/sulfur reductase-like enzyme
MPKFRMNRKNRDEKHQAESLDFSISFPRPPPTPPRSIDLQISSRFKPPQDSTQELLAERINAWTLNTSEEAAAMHSQISRKPSLRTEHMIRSPPPPVPSDVLVVGAGPAGLMLA